MKLTKCATPTAYCGRLARPLDPAGKVLGKIDIYFEFYPHSGKTPAEGTIVASEGGPGFATTQSRDSYLALYAPLLDTHDVVLMDYRGTGKSGAVDCPSLRISHPLTIENTGACGREMGMRASLYSSAFAADDLAAILDALAIAKIDLYGDSYGTFFAQTFTLRHPTRVRSVVLDGAYPLDGPDYAWYAHYAPAMRDKFNFACQRSLNCSPLAGDSIAHIQPALDALRAHPFKASAPDADGHTVHFEANAPMLATVMFGSAPAYTSIRETDAAARAFAAGDTAPLLRLMAETSGSVESREPNDDMTQFSPGLAAAVACQDPPQVFDMRLQPAERRRQFDQLLTERVRTHPHAFAPFTAAEFLSLPIDYGYIAQCLAWPVSPPEHPASAVVPPGTPLPDVPALILSGDLDNMTSQAEGLEAAKGFPRGRQVVIANGLHVNALPHSRPSCAMDIVRRFVKTLDAGDTSCAAHTVEIHLAPPFAREWQSVAPATALPGNGADAKGLKLAAAAVATAADTLARIYSNSSGAGVGLRGGKFEIQEKDSHERFVLHAVRWTSDLPVNGTIDWWPNEGKVEARLELATPQRAKIQARWNQNEHGGKAQIEGRVGTQPVMAEMLAP